jgi:hypothetical protein
MRHRKNLFERGPETTATEREMDVNDPWRFSGIHRYIAWRNRRVTDPRIPKVIKRAATIKRAKVA